MSIRDISVHRLRDTEVETLEEWRHEYQPADLEIPHGYSGQGVETAVAETREGIILASMTGIKAVILDPLIRNPRVTNGAEMVSAILMLERTLSYLGEQGGAVDSYVAIPNQLADYKKIVESVGYVATCENCTIYRRPLRPDTVPLIGPTRDKADDVIS